MSWSILFTLLLGLFEREAAQNTPELNYSPWSGINRTENITIGFLASYVHTKVVLGALPLAVEAVNRDSSLLPGHRLLFRPVDIGKPSASSYRAQPIRAMTQMRDEGVAAFIGPDDSCTTEALIAAAWNLPMISYKCTDAAVSDKSVFQTFSRTLAPASKVSKSVVALLSSFNWHKFVLVSSSRTTWGFEIALAIKTLAEAENLTVTDFREYSEYIPAKITELQNIVTETYKKTRIYIFVGEHIAMVDFVRCLQNRDLLQTGDYMVISVDDEIYDPTKRSNIMEREYLDPYLKKVRSRALDIKSFHSVLKLTPSYPSNTNFSQISENIRSYATQPPFRVPFHRTIFRNISVPIYGVHLYDAVMIYARAATEVISAGGNIYDAKAIMERIVNRTYHSIQGFDVYIDANGDAEGNFTLISLQDELSLAQALTSDAEEPSPTSNPLKMSMQPVGYFVYSSPANIPEFRYINPQRTIKWLKGVPRAEPVCGFDDELCQPKNKDWRYLLSGVCVALFLAVAGAFLIKHYRYEQTLACLLWKVDLKEVTFITTEHPDSSIRSKNLVQTCRHSLITGGGDTSKRAYTTIGLYRGNIVAVKRIHKRSVDITRAIRKELKQMREVRHENVISFIGASVDPNCIAILTSYCPRGSLDDVLSNEDLYLDNMFISSLVSDILKGMIYIHESEIVSHGNLRASNCLVDSRWVCQITDFGLHEFKLGQEEPNRETVELARNLYRAPELLRHPNPPSRGTQKGDVYSFGVLLYEIIGRNGPWGETQMTKEEIIHKVRSPANGTYYRPPLRFLEIPDYVKQCLKSCWDEDQELRPDLRLVRVKLKEMQAGLKPNIFDNMLAIMEKYAYNLEGLVQERTNQLTEEKKKTEALLHRMLPKTVAESLKRGDPVEAECFDCVTIYFSDLVGFTEMCVQSSPLQVVEMLNDLYTCCDSIISNYDVYKVETIGDAYMVVSGLPIRNGDRHAGEIASLALHLLNKISKLEVRHRAGELIQIRIGIHSGQCVAGVVGVKMPRYCLFGDTVNTASRMESSGLPLKIHISEATYDLLQNIGGYKFEERGLIQIKGKGEMRTYWLLSEDINKKIERFGSSDFDETFYHRVAPDLICTTEPEPMKNSTPNNSYSSLNQRARMSYSSILSYNGGGDKQMPVGNFSKALSNDLVVNSCYICQQKKSLQQTECQRQHRQMYDIYRISSECMDSPTEFSHCPCYCSNQRNFMKRYDSVIREIRAPQSAPHITFMQ
ncbi:guanylate cyclase 32E-like [Phlebotomus argentipes]|uniref:guanylate cyclase 32E-like n=1 Tax=Phlebotomus argentipes TaxID=94469 RepID=UPI002892F708|nr:guanylate cyclase 32E-like [Phlebotomus argentipes]